MLGIPFVNTYIKNVKVQIVADSVDWLNYYVSALMLICCSLAISAKQYFGSPIQCWVPNEFKGGWEKYAEDYCFIANSYYVPMDDEIPSELAGRQDQITYYRWVPIVLALQSILFWLPNYLWNNIHKQTAIHPRALVDDARQIMLMKGKPRESEIEQLAQYISESLSVFHPTQRGKVARSGFNATVMYLFMKLLYTANAIGQLVLLNHFLGGNYFSWGFDTMRDVIHGEEWKESEVFPRVIMCDFSVRKLANIQRHSVQCVIMMNMINEKLYFFLYWWLLFVAVVTAINFVYYLFMLLVPSCRVRFVRSNINQNDLANMGLGRRDIERFVVDFLHCDGVLVLHFIRRHIGGRITYDLMNQLVRIFWQEPEVQTPSNSERSHEPLLRGSAYRRNIGDSQGFKNDLYNPGHMYPNPRGLKTAPKANESLDFVDDSTLPLRDLTNRTPVRSPNQNQYSASPDPNKSTMSVV
ncbi:unnamed protein product [Bursaphelenchus okinawaensis]|uniref:Innexin n=1 Tax=Bursaphelenchus okinawaensis TaxID=465554 RepID=A0A811LT35_9BILA|nr:unnamed protein product [Bursaphelenchus okinawaensis]CAG9128443.1 unnamed protein product [Bursaphelenchus okinawaensis]